MGGVDGGELLGDGVGDQRHGAEVVEDVRVASLLVTADRERVDSVDRAVLRQHGLDEVVVAAAVVDHQLRVG